MLDLRSGKKLADLTGFKNTRQRKRFDEPVVFNFDQVMAYVIQIGQQLMPPGRMFEITNERLEHYHQLIYYFFNHKNFKGDLNKGLFIHGPKGTGKSVSLQVFDVMIKNQVALFGSRVMTKGFSWHACDEEVENFEVKGPSVMAQLYIGNRAFDDLGDEPRSAIYYKKERNLMKDVLTRRYRLWTDFGYLTYLTSNFNLEVIKKEYKSRVEDRFKEQYNDIALVGESLR